MFLSFLQRIAPKKVQNRYSQLNQEKVDKLLISFLRKEELIMADANIIIVSDDGNKINYQEVYTKQVDRTFIADRRARLETLLQQRQTIDEEVDKIEKELNALEQIVAIADEKKAEEEAKAEVEE